MDLYQAFKTFKDKGVILKGITANSLHLEYRKLVKKFHPDLPHNNDYDLKDINVAYELLKDKVKSKGGRFREKWNIYNFCNSEITGKTFVTGSPPDKFLDTALRTKYWDHDHDSDAVFIQNDNIDRNILYLVRCYDLRLYNFIKFDFIGEEPQLDYNFMRNLPDRLDTIYRSWRQ